MRRCEIEQRLSELEIMPPRNFWTGLRFTPESARRHYDEVLKLRKELYEIKVSDAIKSITGDDIESMVKGRIRNGVTRYDAIVEVYFENPEFLHVLKPHELFEDGVTT